MEPAFPSTVFIEFEFGKTIECTLNEGETHYTCKDGNFGELVEMLHGKTSVQQCRVQLGKKRNTMRCLKRADLMKLFVDQKRMIAVKVRQIDFETPPRLLLDDLTITKQVSEHVATDKIMKGIVARFADVVPGFLTVMERCIGDAWMSKDVEGEEALIDYMRFGARACATLASYGYEARDFKANNVGCRRPGSKEKFCIIDTIQIVKLDQCYNAACTYPAVKAWTFGAHNSYVGMAATAWAWIADMFAMMGHSPRRLSHHELENEPDEGDKYAYCKPTRADSMLEWLSLSETANSANVLSDCLALAIDAFQVHFPEGTTPLNTEEAMRHAAAFWGDMALVLRNCGV